MIQSPQPINERARRQVIKDYRLLEIAPQLDLLRLSRATRNLVRAEACAITIVDEDIVWLLARQGLMDRQWVSRDESLAAWAILQPSTITWVRDCSKDERFSHLFWAANDDTDSNTAPEGAGIRMGAAAPLLVKGLPVGALVVFRREAMDYDEDIAGHLQDMASLISEQFELARANEQLNRLNNDLHTKSALMRNFLMQAPVSLAMFDQDMNYMAASPRWIEEYQLIPEKFLGKNLYVLTPEMPSSLQDKHQHILSTGISAKGDGEPFSFANGQTSWIRWECDPWFEPDGTVGGLVMMTENVTKSRQQQTQIQRSEERLHMALEIAEIMVWEYDFRSQEISTNNTRGVELNTPAQPYAEMCQIWAKSLFHEDKERIVKAWEGSIDVGKTFNQEYRQYNHNKELHWVHSVAKRYDSDEGRPERIVGVVRNITQRKKAELLVEEARREAVAANRAKSEFLANMSHEIRTPLNGVLGVVEALAMTPLSPPQKEMVELIDASGKTLAGLLNDLIDLSRVEAGKLKIVTEPFDVRKAADQCAALFMPKAQDKGLNFTVQIEDKIQPIRMGDALRIRQILSNLLSNAIKFTEAGKITLNVRQIDRDTLVFEVQDTGPGFDAEFKSRMFGRFQQADGSSTRKHGGAGLGLAICKSLAELMEGDLDADAIEGKGAQFRLSLSLPEASKTIQSEFAEAERLQVKTPRLVKASPSPDPAPIPAPPSPAQPALSSAEALLAQLLSDSPAPAQIPVPISAPVLAPSPALSASEALLRDLLGDIPPAQDQAVKTEVLAAPHDLAAPASAPPVLLDPNPAPDLAPSPIDEDDPPFGEDSEDAVLDHRLRVLMAEDHEVNQKVVELLLAPYDLDLTCCENGLLAVEAFKIQSFDMVLMDLQMPVMDGLTAMREIRALEHSQKRDRIPIFALTANALPEHMESTRLAGADGHLTKPVNGVQLIDAVAHAYDLALSRQVTKQLHDRLSA